MKKRLLVMKAMELGDSNLQIDDSALNEALRLIDSIFPAQRPTAEITYNSEATNQPALTQPEEKFTIICPPRPKRCGRPRDTTQASWKKHKKLEKDVRRAENKENSSPEATVSTSHMSRTRRLEDLMHVTNRC